uniref:Uncharacterized protein n=1 Tax=Hyaloperonospora arabidopsidis (strain Emoy2) TaxID=559515 RepID=M4C0A2_HYAAE
MTILHLVHARLDSTSNTKRDMSYRHRNYQFKRSLESKGRACSSSSSSASSKTVLIVVNVLLPMFEHTLPSLFIGCLESCSQERRRSTGEASTDWLL